MKIFISYSSKTKPIVAELADDLIASGYTVWFDRELTGGRQWWADILQQIRDCDLFVFALTQQSLDSLPCQREFTYADALNKRILPIQMDDLNIAILPKALQKIQFVNYLVRDKTQYRSLIKALNTLPPPPSAPTWTVAEPPAPLSPLADLRERIDTPNLTIDIQKSLAYDLTAAYRNPATQRDAQMLVEILLRREDELNVRIHRDLTDILSGTISKLLIKNVQWQSLILHHKKQVLSVDISLVNDLIVTGTASGLISIWNGIGHEIQQIKAHLGSIFSVKFSPNSETVISSGFDNSIRLWEVSNGNEMRRFSGHSNSVTDVVFSPNGKNIASSSVDSTVRLWDLSTGREIIKFGGHLSSVTSVIFLHSGDKIISGGRDGQLNLWEISSGKRIPHFERYGHAIESIAISSDDRYVITGNEDHTLCLWEMHQGRKIKLFKGHTDIVTDVAFSPDMQMVVSGCRDGVIRLWEINTGRKIHSFEEHSDYITSVVFAPDGKAILSGSWDGTARILPLDGII